VLKKGEMAKRFKRKERSVRAVPECDIGDCDDKGAAS
jgi:hypothetical protein